MRILDWMPERASTWAANVDFINNFISWVSLFCIVTITGAMLYFGWKYRRSENRKDGAYITHDATLETVWTVVPTLVCIYVFWYGFVVYRDMRTPPANPLEVEVKASQWQWEFTYPNGKKDAQLVVPINQPVRLVMRSMDVNHSLFIPAMRAKEDIIANVYHQLWFQPTKLGKFPIFCTEYCGISHYAMLSTLLVVSASQYEDYLSDRGGPVLTPEQLGQKVYSLKGCAGCHTLDGTKLIGPSFKGIWGREEEMEGGEKIKVDENYVLESLREPQKKIVKGYQPLMAVQHLSDEEFSQLIAFLKTLN